ncbi:MAG: hypothetical protein R3F51_27325 [Cyanobacteriota/Melainabacteria group bacterium]
MSLQGWLRRCSLLSESAERSYEIDTAYRAEKIIPKQSNPRFSKVVGPASIFCRVKEDGTLYDFKVFASSGDEDFDFCGLLVLKAMKMVPKCPEDLPYQRGLIFNFSNRAAQARRSVYIAPASLDAGKFYKGVSQSAEATRLTSSIILRRVNYSTSTASEANLQKSLQVIEKLKTMKNEMPGLLIAVECHYINDLLDADRLEDCRIQIEELTDIIKCNSLFAVTYGRPMDPLTSIVSHIVENWNKGYSPEFIQKVKELIAATEANTDFGIRTKNGKDPAVFTGDSKYEWVSYSRFKDTKQSNFARPLVDAIYRGKKERIETNLFPNKCYMANFLQLDSERSPFKPPEKYTEALKLRTLSLTPAHVLGTVENNIEDYNFGGAEAYVEDILKKDVVTRSDSFAWSSAFAELSTIFSRQNRLDLADRLLRKAVDYRLANYNDELKLLISKYSENNEYDKACAFYDYMQKRSGKDFYKRWASELLIEASVKDKARSEYWYKKSEEIYQSLLKQHQNSQSGESFILSMRDNRIKCLEAAGYKREAWTIKQYEKNSAEGEGALQDLKSMSHAKDPLAPGIMKARIQACKWMIQNKRYREADKIMLDITSDITKRPWTYENKYDRLSYELDTLFGEALGIEGLRDSLNKLSKVVEKDTNKGINSAIVFSYGERYGTINSKVAIAELQCLYQAKLDRFQPDLGQLYLESWLQDLVSFAERLGKYDDAVKFQTSLVARNKQKGDSYRRYYNNAAMDLVRLEFLAGNVEEGRKGYDSLDIDPARFDLKVVYALAAGLSDAKQIELADKTLRIALKKSFYGDDSNRAIDKFIAACCKDDKIQTAMDLLNYIDSVHSGKNYYTNYAKKKRAEIRSFDKPAKK